MIQVKSIYDLFSLVILIPDIYLLYTFDIYAIVGTVFVLLLLHIIKQMTTGLEPSSIFKRPPGATNCGLFNTGGLVEHQSGFPSGHMTSITFMMMYILLKTSKVNFTNLILFNIPILLVAIGRYYKGCHRLIQIIAGYILGGTMALFFYYNKKYICGC